MSHWTYVSGLIRVSPTGRTQPEKRYALETVLEHLPAVSSSEGYMDTYIIQRINKWLNRLAKRVSVEEILVKVSDLNKEYFYTNSVPYEDMYEYNPSWTDYLLWNYEEDRLNHE